MGKIDLCGTVVQNGALWYERQKDPVWVIAIQETSKPQCDCILSFLDKRHIEGVNGRVPQVLIQCFIQPSIVQDLLDLLRVYCQETPE